MSPLDNIDHIVVLMLENRSFDHMLGYLSLEGRTDVDGLDGTHRNADSEGTWHGSKRAGVTVFRDDPNHDWNNVADQLSNQNSGFVVDFENLAHGQEARKERFERIMEYHTADQVPVFDLLAKEYCISDRWFASVPGPTQPNRIYALAGTSNGLKDNLSKWDLAVTGWQVKPIFRYLPRDVSWRCYSYDISTLRFVDGFRGHVSEIDKIYRFFGDARAGRLANVTWIDPHFDLLWGLFPGDGNDDHPDHDIRDGQRLVGDIYNALVNSPNWDRTLFVVVYDEHGGFYDHVPPGEAADDHAEFKRYGVRVPALIVSPRVGKGICYGRDSGHVFDHTSILKTILHRFCKNPDGTIPRMSARVEAATDLSVMLTEPAPRQVNSFDVETLDKGAFRSAIEDNRLLKTTGLPIIDETDAEMAVYRRRLEGRLADNVVKRSFDDLVKFDLELEDLNKSMKKTVEAKTERPSELQEALRDLADSIRQDKDEAAVPLNKL